MYVSFPIPELEFLRSGYFVVKLFSSRYYVYCFRFEMDMFRNLEPVVGETYILVSGEASTKNY